MPDPLPMILIVEDETDLRVGLVDALAKDYRLLEATDGEQGSAHATGQSPDLVLTEVMMPGMDGFTLCRMLKQREDTCHIPVIVKRDLAILGTGKKFTRFVRIVFFTLLLQVSLQPFAQADVIDLPGRVVAVWSKGAGKFVRSAEVDDGVLRADSKSYETSSNGRFLCFAEAGGTIAIMDVMLERYLTHVGGNLASAVSGTPSSRRFTLLDQGNNYHAIRADNGKYVQVNGAGNLVVDATTITDNAVFAIVPIRTGPNVVMRAYKGWEADIYSTNHHDFPVNKVNIGMLQMTPDLYTDTQFTNMRAVWNTDNYETEFILPYTTNPAVSLTTQVDRLVNRIKRMERLGYTFDYVILYHEILADLPGGPWSDPRICSQEELDLFRERVTVAYNAGEVKHASYKVFTMPYQFTSNSLMGIPPYENTPVGCDAATLAFIKQNYDGMFLEVNGQDYASRDEHIDAAAAAVWCRDNGLEFGITSGGAQQQGYPLQNHVSGHLRGDGEGRLRQVMGQNALCPASRFTAL